MKKAFLDSIPVMTGYIFIGIGYGILSYSQGLGIFWTVLMSLVIYAGSLQFLAVGLLTSGASFLTFAISTFMINARHLFYGISMIEKYKHAGKVKPYLIFALTDETYSLVCRNTEETKKTRYCFFLSFFNHIYWITGSFLGAWLGKVIPFNTNGIEFALTALFISVVTEQWEQSYGHISAIIGITAAVICRIIFGAGSFLIPTMIVIVTILSLLSLSRKVQK